VLPPAAGVAAAAKPKELLQRDTTEEARSDGERPGIDATKPRTYVSGAGNENALAGVLEDVSLVAGRRSARRRRQHGDGGHKLISAAAPKDSS